MHIDLTPLIQALIVVLATIITAKVVPWIKAHTNAQQQIIINAVVKTAVLAAEQLYGAGTGADKLAYATKYLADRGYTVDQATIEAAVKEFTGKVAN